MVTEAELQRDLQAAMRARDRRRMDVLRGLITAIKNAQVEKRARELAASDLIAIVRRELNKRLEIIEYAKKGGRPELVAQNQAEKEILEGYLPPQLDQTALEAAIAHLAEELGTAQIGPLMAELGKRHPGQFNAKQASELIRKIAKS